jgi:hypothetical protein
MPPRHAYWTILVDEQPTAFRAAMQDDLQPTFKRLKEKHASARMVWFQNGKIWNSRLDAQEAMRARGELGRRGDVRQGGGFRDRARQPQTGPPADRRDASGKLEWKPKSGGAARDAKLVWRPRGAATAVKPGDATTRRSRREARPVAKPGEHRDRKWRPGGEHRDPRQKYKDAKKAKWTRFKQTIRKRWESKAGKKKKDE